MDEFYENLCRADFSVVNASDALALDRLGGCCFGPFLQFCAQNSPFQSVAVLKHYSHKFIQIFPKWTYNSPKPEDLLTMFVCWVTLHELSQNTLFENKLWFLSYIPLGKGTVITLYDTQNILYDTLMNLQAFEQWVWTTKHTNSFNHRWNYYIFYSH